MFPTLLALPSLVLGTFAAAPAPCRAPLVASQDANDGEALRKLREFLERQPFHVTAFERLVQAALAEGGLEGLELWYRERIERDAGDAGARIVLARLLARARRGDEALGLLAPLQEENAQLCFLRGRLELARGELRAGAEALDRAAVLSLDPRERTEILTLAGRTWARQREEERALASFGALSALDAESFPLALEVAALLEESGFAEEARAELGRALELASGDSERTVRAQVALGRLEERRGRVAEAKAAYLSATRGMHPEHWLRRELVERLLALYRADGDLAALVALAREDVARTPSDPGAREFLARSLIALGESEQALEVLAAAARDFPGSAGLGRAHAQQLAAGGRAEEAVAEYQRLASLLEEEIWPLLEAGTMLAALGERETALEQWRAALARRPRSVELRLDLARLLARFGLDGEADELLLAALRANPGDLRPAHLLAQEWRERGNGARAEPLFGELQLEAVRRGDARLLEELAYVWLEREQPERAIRVLEEALLAGGDRAPLLRTLAALLEESGSFARTAEVLDELFVLARTAGDRYDLVGRMAGLFAREGRLTGLLRAQRSLVESGAGGLRATLVLAQALVRQGTAEADAEARALLEPLKLAGESREDALLHLAWLHAQFGRFAEAALELQLLRELHPEDRSILERQGALYRQAGNTAAFCEAAEELLRTNPRDRDLLRDLVERTQRGPEAKQALRLLRRAVELLPDDGEVRLALGAGYANSGWIEEARSEIARVLGSEDPALRAKARDVHRSRLRPHLVPEVEIERLRELLAQEPWRFELGILAAELARELHDYSTAWTIAEELWLRFPREPALIELREALRGLTVASASVPFDARSSGGPDLELAQLLLAQGEAARARAILARLDDPVVAANLFLSRGEPVEARRLLDALCRERPGEPELCVRLAVAYLAEGREGWALRELDELFRETKAPWALLLVQGELCARRGDRRGTREAAKALLATLDDTRGPAAASEEALELHRRRVLETARFHEEHRLDFLSAGEALLAEHPEDTVVLEEVLARFHQRDARRARALIDAVRAGVRGAPAGWSSEQWQAYLDRRRAEFPLTYGVSHFPPPSLLREGRDDHDEDEGGGK